MTTRKYKTNKDCSDKSKVLLPMLRLFSNETVGYYSLTKQYRTSILDLIAASEESSTPEFTNLKTTLNKQLDTFIDDFNSIYYLIKATEICLQSLEEKIEVNNHE
ncbi:hypothetical protein [Lapidilactobacillus dextrinicus]|uniref:hypothetical protein n=1 Tax=Lapidilactobacillus dextrinicus TaxID=51664 RepID=UPI0022E51D8E|nr:hypothetical protein [Lapidilactobacillus dextrinicus]